MNEWKGTVFCDKCGTLWSEEGTRTKEEGHRCWWNDCDGKLVPYDRRVPDPEKAEACPGDLIANIHCPECGVKIRVEHGDDPGEVGAISNTDPDPEKEEKVKVSKKAAAMEWCFEHGPSWVCDAMTELLVILKRYEDEHPIYPTIDVVEESEVERLRRHQDSGPITERDYLTALEAERDALKARIAEQEAFVAPLSQVWNVTSNEAIEVHPEEER